MSDDLLTSVSIIANLERQRVHRDLLKRAGQYAIFTIIGIFNLAGLFQFRELLVESFSRIVPFADQIVFLAFIAIIMSIFIFGYQTYKFWSRRHLTDEEAIMLAALRLDEDLETIKDAIRDSQSGGKNDG